jgi:heme o synthase
LRTSSTISKHWSNGINIARSFRLPISAMVTLSSVCGFYLQQPDSPALIPLFLGAGVFSLASGATVLNQVQERTTDLLMTRTSSRLVTSGRLSSRQGVVISLILIATGLILLVQTGNGAVPTLGLLCLILYNGIYTLLKPHSNWSLIPGGVCGALPPLMGWLAAEGSVNDYRIWLFATVLFLWQVPHFWFLSASHCEDFRKAGLPTIFDHLHPGQFKRVSAAWLITFLASVSLLAAFEVVRQAWTQGGLFLLAGSGLFLGIKGILSSCGASPTGYKNLFLSLNLLMVGVLFLILLDRL